ncbi:MAG: TonB-dependent receptor [Gammaproteobacteria bacterium]|nr:TonB-dependent receptor [Gammaproteobacteria bacterium]
MNKPSTLTSILSSVLSGALMASFLSLSVFAQEEEVTEEEVIEEVVVTGTQIRGADVSGLLPVTVIDGDDVDAMGVDSGDALMEMLPEQGQNFFNEEENISGGVNSARGDIGAFNLRNLGTGNTLVLLNGRRMVNAASFQTEEIGGSFVPVNTVNSNTLPVFGIERVELLKDGASAIYGADAVAGVVNTVLKNDIEGLRVKMRGGLYEHVSRQSYEVNVEWGRYFNDGATHVGLMFDTQSRDRISASESDRWAHADFRSRVPDDSPWAGDLRFRNTSANSLYGQFDVVRSVSGLDIRGPVTDRSGEFETYPTGDSRCAYAISTTVCGAPDGQGTYRYNLNEFRDLSAELMRNNVFAFINHDISDTTQSFTEVLYYKSESHMNRHPSASFSSIKLRISPDHYYNPFGPCDSPNRLPENVIGDVPCSGLELIVDNYRFAELPRSVSNDGSVFRFVQGLRGVRGEWDWETAAVWSIAQRYDLTGNRVSNLLMAEALSDPTPAAYNPFAGGVDNNIERALIDVYRENDAGLLLMDLKFSNPEVMTLPAGPLGALIGYEHRREWFKDDRDPRLDGTIVFTDFEGDTFPFVSDVVNSSPTPDNDGSRRVDSLFAELAIPVASNVEAQAAVRFENFSDVDHAVVGKLAMGWQIADPITLRASWSESFRVPNLVTINESIVARQNTRTDYACIYAANQGGDPGQDIVDCVNSTQRTARGSEELVPERSDNISIGLVFDVMDSLTVTTDYWSIVKEDTIGLFGEANHTVLDLIYRLQHGGSNCDALVGNPAVVRNPITNADEIAVYEAAGICPAGQAVRVDDRYANLDTRTLKGFDLGVYWEAATDFGDVSVRYLATFMNTFEQEAGGDAATLIEAKNSGLLPGDIPVVGFDDLVERNGNPKFKGTLLATWRKDQWGGALSQTTIGDMYQNSLTLSDGTKYWLGAMSTWNVRLDYRFDLQDTPTRVRIGIKNLFDERAPLADRYFGFFADAHRDYGRYIYSDIMFSYD